MSCMNKYPHLSATKRKIFGLQNRQITIVFNWIIFEMRLLNLRINFYLLQTFCPHLSRVFFLCCFFFHYVSAKFHLWPSSGDFAATSDRNDRQQLWKAVIAGNTVTRLIIPIRGRGKITWRRPEVKFGRNVVKEETTQKNLLRWGQKVRNK